ncbi:hypothetical protein [Alistipes provencensis]|uniref:hypothetical protein n=1 Tax=Alistipes provencensis TaxID=1816676 RepID=UPI000A7FE003|nr:hypothetical protein [Alistipes provencensis]
MSILAGLAGAAGNFAFDQLSNSINSRRQQRYNERNMELQQKYQKEMIDYVADKNSPMKSAARWRAAGISPADVFGNSPGGAGIASDAAGPSSSNPDGGSSRYDFVRTIAESQMMRNQQRLTDAEVDLKEAQAQEARSRTTGQDIENSMSDLLKRAKSAAAGIAELEEKIKGIEAKWLEAEKAKDMEIKDSILRETDQRISNLMSDKAYKEQATEKLRSDMDLIKAQIATESSKQHNLDAQTETENQTRKGKVDKLTEEVNNLIANTDLSNEKSRTELYGRLVDVLGLYTTKTMAEEGAKQIINRNRRNDWRFERLSTSEIERFLDKTKR